MTNHHYRLDVIVHDEMSVSFLIMSNQHRIISVANVTAYVSTDGIASRLSSFGIGHAHQVTSNPVIYPIWMQSGQRAFVLSGPWFTYMMHVSEGLHENQLQSIVPVDASLINRTLACGDLYMDGGISVIACENTSRTVSVIRMLGGVLVMQGSFDYGSGIRSLTSPYIPSSTCANTFMAMIRRSHNMNYTNGIAIWDARTSSCASVSPASVTRSSSSHIIGLENNGNGNVVACRSTNHITTWDIRTMTPIGHKCHLPQHRLFNICLVQSNIDSEIYVVDTSYGQTFIASHFCSNPRVGYVL